MRIFIPMLFVSTSVFAQNVQKEINEQVWKPFIAGFQEGNTDVFMGVHSKDLVRSARESKKVLNWEEYYNETRSGNARRATDKSRVEIELRFTERINSAGQAIDVGVYKTSWFAADGKSGAGYGRFHVVMRKEDGTWKILVDTDSNENRTIGETQFLAARPME
jgi:hypothetical protein